MANYEHDYLPGGLHMFNEKDGFLEGVLRGYR